MHQFRRKLIASGFALFGLSCMTSALAATPVDLQDQPLSFLQSLVTAAASQSNIKELRQSVDFTHARHIRVQQTYAGYPVFGGDAIIHLPANDTAKSLQAVLQNLKNSQATMNGTMYQNLAADLKNTSADVFDAKLADKMLQQAIQLHQQKVGQNAQISHAKSKLMVYVDQNNKAHWVYFISFVAKSAQAKMPEMPTFIMDATNYSVYKQWNNIQTLDDTGGGGFGGNPKMGKLAYDALAGDYPTLAMERDASTQLCYLQNETVTVRDVRGASVGDEYPIVQFACGSQDPNHNNIYWDADQDHANEAYSPSNDALYVGKVIHEMYMNWYGIPPLTQADGQPMMLNMDVHEDMENAYWDGESMHYGDGGDMFYPLVSLGVGAHEISHGFTEQHSDLVYQGQSGGLNESFSDMAAQAAEFYSVGQNSWQIGPEIMKDQNAALRYMDMPSKDCNGGKPGNWCSIDNVKEYSEGLDVHFSSGVFNRLFYQMGTAKGWDTKKAFDVMVLANQNYWTSTTSFADAACGVLKATKDYGYDQSTVVRAIRTVGLHPLIHCKMK